MEEENAMVVDDFDYNSSISSPRFTMDTVRSHHHDVNATTITSTVHIRVTPRQDHLYSWTVLWVSFFFASIWAAWQVYREHKTIQAREAADVEHGGVEAVSTADRMRCTFRRLLLLAMFARLISMPVMIWSDPLWFQFVGDTLPEMIFATAWTLMVTFFVQLVGSATGTVTNADASIVIQATAYIVYTCLIVLELFNSVASVLLYALLCCIYAALLGAIAYFCPKLFSLLSSNMLLNQGSLVIRLYVCTVVCLLVFAGHMVGFARIVIAAPERVYWWIKFGLLELVPALIFMFIMNPNPGSKANRYSPEVSGDESNNNNNRAQRGGTPPLAAMKRVDSVGSASSSQKRSGGGGVGETVSLLKPSPSYGSAANSDNNG